MDGGLQLLFKMKRDGQPAISAKDPGFHSCFAFRQDSSHVRHVCNGLACDFSEYIPGFYAIFIGAAAWLHAGNQNAPIGFKSQVFGQRRGQILQGKTVFLLDVRLRARGNGHFFV